MAVTNYLLTGMILQVFPKFSDTVDGRNPANHLGFIKPVMNHGINCQPQLVSRILFHQPYVIVISKDSSYTGLKKYSANGVIMEKNVKNIR